MLQYLFGILIFVAMKGNIYCPRCKEQGRKPKILGKYEGVVGKGDLYLFCKVCKKEVLVKVENISLDR